MDAEHRLLNHLAGLLELDEKWTAILLLEWLDGVAAAVTVPTA